jgi:hypothetical protein
VAMEIRSLLRDALKNGKLSPPSIIERMALKAVATRQWGPWSTWSPASSLCSQPALRCAVHQDEKIQGNDQVLLGQETFSIYYIRFSPSYHQRQVMSLSESWSCHSVLTFCAGSDLLPATRPAHAAARTHTDR